MVLRRSLFSSYIRGPLPDMDYGCSEQAIEGLEDLALSFVSQLANAIAMEMPSEDDDSQKTLISDSLRSKRRIVLELADRSKIKCDGR